ncbi:unnamed protein product [Allacma fusca]|uniref:Uncharacterized protein n=1 Tax=Allacma fusca TaxID=39272 RepID=A0A8J2P0T2_9HEXA|nr:unnamed protein product [Allacma fusca]
MATLTETEIELRLLFILLVFIGILILCCFLHALMEISPGVLQTQCHTFSGYLRNHCQNVNLYKSTKMGNCCVKAYVEESDNQGGSAPNPLIIGLAGHLRHHFASRSARELDDLPPSYDNYSPPSYEDCVVVVDDKLPIIS